MGDPYPYGVPVPDFQQLIGGRTHLHSADPSDLPEPPLPLLSAAPPPPNSYDVVFSHGFTHHFAAHHHDYSSSSVSNPIANPTVTASVDHATSIDEKGWLGFDATANNRWPRQETLSLLEIRSRLDSKFRDTNHKGPLWNEISRIMEEEYGYQRSGKKCKEKFENLYKYYKKTKEGKAGRQDGKHYRFFRQLEAICGEASTTSHASTNSETTHHHHHHHALLNTTITPTTSSPYDSEVLHHHHHHLPNLKCSKSLSLSNNNSSEFETSSSENNNDEDLSAIAYMMKQKGSDEKRQSGGRVRRSRRAKVEEIVDSHMRKIIETQDAWMKKMMRVVEQREQEMASKEEERKRNDCMRIDRKVHELWAKERARIEAKDAALMEAVKRHLGKEISISLEAVPLTTNEVPQNKNNSNNGAWTELEISNLIQLRSGFEVRLQESGINGGYLVEENNGVWDEIAARMGCLGFERNASECKQIWGEISLSLNKTRPFAVGLQLTEDDISHSSTNAGTRGNYLTATPEF